MAKQPFLKFFPSDWRSDPALRVCSLAARGLWIEMLAIMHEADPRGSLLISGKAPTPAQLASLVGASLEEVQMMLAELEGAGVFSRKRNGVIYSRRIERDEIKASKNRENGKKGGNPTLTKQTEIEASDNPQVKAHIPEARSQSIDEIGSARDLERILREAAGWQNEPHPNLCILGEIEALIASGISLEKIIVPVIRAWAPRARSRTSWRYFLPIIQQTHADSIAAATGPPSAAVVPFRENNRNPSHGTYRPDNGLETGFNELWRAIGSVEDQLAQEGGRGGTDDPFAIPRLQQNAS